MVKFSAITLLLLFSMAIGAHSGTEAQPTPRQEFKQSKTYPYVFIPVGYLSNGGPLPLLFGPAAADCENRNPPPPPKIKKEETKPTPAATPTHPAKSTPTPATPETSGLPTPTPPPSVAPEETPAYPPPESPTLPQDESLDLTKYPAEVIDIFKNPYTVPKSRQHFFDPVFEPPQVQPPGGAPVSKATSSQQ